MAEGILSVLRGHCLLFGAFFCVSYRSYGFLVFLVIWIDFLPVTGIY